MLGWGAPKEPNGEILRYELTYTVNKSRVVQISVERDTTFTFPEPPWTRISNISIRAYTRVGPGVVTILQDMIILEQGKF